MRWTMIYKMNKMEMNDEMNEMKVTRQTCNRQDLNFQRGLLGKTGMTFYRGGGAILHKK